VSALGQHRTALWPPAAPQVRGFSHGPIPAARNVAEDPVKLEGPAAASPDRREALRWVICDDAVRGARVTYLVQQRRASLLVAVVCNDNPPRAYAACLPCLHRLEELPRLGARRRAHVQHRVICSATVIYSKSNHTIQMHLGSRGKHLSTWCGPEPREKDWGEIKMPSTAADIHSYLERRLGAAGVSLKRPPVSR